MRRLEIPLHSVSTAAPFPVRLFKGAIGHVYPKCACHPPWRATCLSMRLWKRTCIVQKYQVFPNLLSSCDQGNGTPSWLERALTIKKYLLTVSAPLFHYLIIHKFSSPITPTLSNTSREFQMFVELVLSFTINFTCIMKSMHSMRYVWQALFFFGLWFCRCGPRFTRSIRNRSAVLNR